MVPALSNAGWSPSGIVTLTTDFGALDPYVGIMKGVMLSQAAAHPEGPRLEIVDLTHGIRPQAVRDAAFHLEHSWRHFPAGTVHLAVVDPGVGTGRGILVCELGGHVFMAPDNGLLGRVLAGAEGPGAPGTPGTTGTNGTNGPAHCRHLDVPRFAGPELSRTFHGRDLFAPLAARLALGLSPREVGPETSDWEGLVCPRPTSGPEGEVLCEVQLVDGFGNLITSARAADLEGPPEAWICEVGAARFPLRGTYAEGAPGELLALVDSVGFWEVAVRDGDAAGRLAAGPGTPVVFRRKG